ncbi:protein brambleberry-like isoform X2 [Portunus trituberculatus]|uniref:protein brambleberry-like isoform X2 n=1 Tax=Portunus trituberculatus TaxID=210409 RepID=UPI001E1CB756|nr:protein brambleberry-like isoform X2 [Portunus trituberculatus]
MRLLVVILVIFLVNQCQGGLFSWLFKKKKDEERQDKAAAAPNSNGHLENPAEAKEVATTAKIPFEIKSSDEKFLKEATELGTIKLSELDVCHHKVVLALEKSCGELNEEDLSKVAVNLLNCQSAIEDRAVFPCTSDMSLSECTRNMDSNTWNAYHIVSNRARAVCYASRQEQFGAKTQMAVNVLMQTAEEQIKSMSDLQEGQMALGKATSDTLDSLSQGHEHLKHQQQQLSTAHQHVHSYISLNLRELSREKKLIASGQKELALITESIKRKIEEAKQQLMSQEDKQRASHDVILQDLSRIQDNALKIWQKLNASTQNILLAHEETVQQYSRLSDDVQRMNATVHHLMDMLQSTRQGVEDQLSWITSLVGGTDNTVQKVYTCVLHSGYFLVAMISATFLQVPYLTRVALVVLVPLNAFSEIKHETSLQFSTLTTVLALCIIVNLTLSCLWSLYKHHKKSKCEEKSFLHLTGSVLERTQELDQHSSLQYGNNRSASTSSSSPSSSLLKNCDFSSDEEEEEHSPVAPSSISFLRRSTLSGGKVNTLETHKEADCLVQDSDPESEHITPEKNGELDTTAKTLSNVRCRLLDHIDTYQPKMFHHNLSVDKGNTASSSPLKETVLNRSIVSSKSLTPRKLCASVCKNGQLCRNMVTGGSVYCHRHGGSSRESTPMSRGTSRRNTPLRS